MSMKLMVVDDDPAALDLVKALVEPQGYEVLALTDSRRAAEWVNMQPFDGIFVDVLMPRLDGFELTKLIRASRLNSRAAIVMITASQDIETMRRGFKAGVTFFLTKPFNAQKLRGLLLALRSAISRERKRNVRLPFCAKVMCRWGYMQSESQSVNINEYGMLLEAPTGPNLGQEIKIEFTFSPSQKSLSLRAKVVHREPPVRIEVQFQNLNSEDLETIREYISRHSTEQAPGL